MIHERRILNDIIDARVFSNEPVRDPLYIQAGNSPKTRFAPNLKIRQQTIRNDQCIRRIDESANPSFVYLRFIPVALAITHVLLLFTPIL